MAYTIKKTDGTVLATVLDNTADITTASLALIGKNYASYGTLQNENFVHLLENSASPFAPSTPVEGQLWWDTTNKVLNTFNGTAFKPISNALVSAVAPTAPQIGDFWWNSVNSQLTVYDGTGFSVVGPGFTTSDGKSGAIVESIIDTLSVTHVAVMMYVANTLISIVSKDAAYTPQVAIPGFTTITPGVNLVGVATIPGSQFNGLAANSTLLNNFLDTQFLRSDINDSTTGTLAIANNTGITVGTNNDISLSVAGTTGIIANNTSNGDIRFGVNIAGVQTQVLTLTGAAGNLIPTVTNTYDIGTPAVKFKTIFSTSFDGTLLTAAQPNITSVGTLGSLSVTGAIIAGTLTGTISTAAQPNITSVGTLGSLSVTGAIIAGTLTGTISTAAQPNITSVGTQAAALNMGANKVTNASAGTALTDLVTLAQLNAVASAGGYVLPASFPGTLLTAAQPNITSLGAQAASLNMGGSMVINAGPGISSTDLVTVAQLNASTSAPVTRVMTVGGYVLNAIYLNTTTHEWAFWASDPSAATTVQVGGASGPTFGSIIGGTVMGIVPAGHTFQITSGGTSFVILK